MKWHGDMVCFLCFFFLWVFVGLNFQWTLPSWGCECWAVPEHDGMWFGLITSYRHVRIRLYEYVHVVHRVYSHSHRILSTSLVWFIHDFFFLFWWMVPSPTIVDRSLTCFFGDRDLNLDFPELSLHADQTMPDVFGRCLDDLTERERPHIDHINDPCYRMDDWKDLLFDNDTTWMTVWA